MINKLNPVFFLVFLLLLSCQNDNDDNEKPETNTLLTPDTAVSYQEFIKQNYQVFPMPLPNELVFCGDKIPLNRSHVRENLDREILVNTYWHSNTFLYQKRSKRWFPFIEKILTREGVPADLKYLALIESGLTDVVSPAGATGFWQFMDGTGKDYGLEITEYVDERYHIEKSTVAACKYLKRAYKEFGSWPLAAASYNMGKGALSKVLKKQKVDSYFDLHLNKETSRYVYRILAAKLILENSENFGFYFRKQDGYLPYATKTLSVDTTINDLAQFSIDQGINYQILRLLNPWIINYSLPNKEGKTYYILIPKNSSKENDDAI